MSELMSLQDMANGHLDLKALGEAANGDENTIVTTRTGNTYPSAERAINIMFKNGGLPAEPFETLAKMQTDGASLADGQLAMVYNETANNGLYFKTAETWVRSDYDPLLQAKTYTNETLSENIKFESTGNLFNGQFVAGFVNSVTNGEQTVYQYIKRPVGQSAATYENATSAIVAVEGNTQYTVKVFDTSPTRSFRLVSYNDAPVLVDTPNFSSPEEKGNLLYYDGKTSNYVSNFAGLKEFTFTTRANDRFILMTFDVTTKVRPKFAVSKGTRIDNYEPASKVITNIKNLYTTLESLPFLLDSPKNLFDGNYKNLVLTNVGSSVLKLSPNISASRGKTAIIPVKSNTTYTVRTHSAHGRFRAALAAEYPTFISELHTLTIDNVYVNSDFVFTTNDDSKYLLIYVSTENETPLLQVEEGAESTPYSSNGQINADRLQSLGLQTERSVNLFDNKVRGGTITTSGTGVITLDTSAPKSSGGYAIIKVNPSQAYAIKLHEDDASGIPFRFVFLSNYPDLSTTTITLSKIDYESTNFDKTVLIAPETVNYLLIQSPYLVYGKRLQVEKGATHTAYKEYFVIPDEKLSVTSSDSGASGLFSPKRAFMFNADLNQLYRRGRVLEDYFTTPTDVKPDEVYARYDAIMSALPDGFMTKKALGVDGFGNTIYEYETNPTILYEVKGSQNWVDGSPNNVPIRQPVIYITSGIHGNEKTAVFGLMYALSDIYLNPTNDPLLDYIRRTVKIILCPIINPSGFIANTRRNGNNVDLNRDFAPSGATTQSETPVIKQALAVRAPILDYQIECHTSYGAVPEMLGYVLTDEPELSFAIPDMYQQLGREMQKEFPQLNQDPFNRWVYKAETVNNTFFKYAQNTLGLRGVTLETKNNIAPISSSYHHSENVVFYSELVVNTIIIMMKCLQRD